MVSHVTGGNTYHYTNKDGFKSDFGHWEIQQICAASLYTAVIIQIIAAVDKQADSQQLVSKAHDDKWRVLRPSVVA